MSFMKLQGLLVGDHSQNALCQGMYSGTGRIGDLDLHFCRHWKCRAFKTVKSIFLHEAFTSNKEIFLTRMHSSRMRTARPLPCRGGSNWTETPLDRDPPPLDRDPPRQRPPWTETRPGQIPPLWTDRHLWNYYLTRNFVYGPVKIKACTYIVAHYFELF